MASDEPSIPMDQEEEDNDEYFSARESLKKGNQESPRSTTPTPQRSDRDASPSNKSGSSGRQQAFYSDEKAQQGSENSTKKSEKVRRLLKDRNRWDMREWKKEELDAKPKKTKIKKGKAKNKKNKDKVMETLEKSKTDEESDDNDQSKEPEPSSGSASEGPQARSFFQSENLILKCKQDKPIAPKCKFGVLRFAKTQEVVEYDAEGMQHLLDHYNERAISNPWRRWGAHRALCDQGGFLVDKNKKLVEIKRGSDPPPCPPNPRQVTLNKNCEAPDSQTMMGTLKVEVGPAEEEVHRIGRVMEDYVLKNGGFVPPPMTKKEMARPARPQVVVKVKGGNQPKDGSAVKVKAKRKKNSKPKEKKKTQSQSASGSGEESEETEEEGSVVEKAKKKQQEANQQQQLQQQQQQPRDDSKKGGGAYGFLKRKIKGAKGKKNNKGSIR